MRKGRGLLDMKCHCVEKFALVNDDSPSVEREVRVLS